MVRLVLASLVFALSVTAQNASAASAPDFSSRWVTTPTAEIKVPTGTVEAKILTRMVRVGDTAFRVGNVTYYRYPKPRGEKFDARKIAADVARAMGFARWQERRQGEAFVFETMWKNNSRFVRLYVRDHGRTISYSVALLRTAYASNTVLEAEIIQRRLAQVIGKRTWPWLEDLISKAPSLFREAHAQKTPPPLPDLDLIESSSDSLDRLEQRLGKMDETLFKTGATDEKRAVHFNDSFDRFQKHFMPQLKRWTGMAIKDDKMARDALKLGKKYEKLGSRYAALGERGMEVSERGMDLLEAASDPRNLMLWSAAASGGAALGAIAVSTAADAVVMGGGALINILHEAVTHEKEHSAIIERFRAARETWEARKLAIQQFEGLIDNLVELKLLAASSGLPREALLLELGTEMQLQKYTAEAHARASKEALAAGDVACAREETREQVKIEQWLKGLESVTALVADQPGDEQICGEIKEQVRKLIQAEADLEEARSAILAGRDLWQAEYEKRRTEMYRAFDRAKEKRPEVAAMQIHQADMDEASAKAMYAKDRQAWIDRCVDERSNWAQKIPILSVLALRSVVHSDCESEFKKGIKLAFEGQHRSNIERGAKDRRESAKADVVAAGDTDPMLQPNPELAAAEVRSYNDWFKEVENEQKCMNAHWACPDTSIAYRLRNKILTQNKVEDFCGKRALTW